MIDVYYWTTPNGHKIPIFLEEAGLPYNIKPINLKKNEQFSPDYLAISPNNKIPAIVDHAPLNGAKSLSIFESGAILLYLAEKTGKFLSPDLKEKNETIEWLFWQIGGLGPMGGQTNHFKTQAPEKIPYAIERFEKEMARLYGVLNKHLSDHRPYVAGKEYSIADMAIYPWTVPHEKQGVNWGDYPYVKKWFEKIKHRPAVQRVYEKAKEINPDA